MKYIFLLFCPYKHNFTLISKIKKQKIFFVTFLFFKIINLNYEISFKIRNICCNYSFEDFIIFILLLLKFCFNKKIFILMVINI